MEETYPCVDCGKPRTKAEGGTTFTVCDECWDKRPKSNLATIQAQSARIEELTKALERSKIRMETVLKTLHEKSGEHLDLSLGIAQIDAALSPTPTNGKDAE